jgi:hypothetical protein
VIAEEGTDRRSPVLARGCPQSPYRFKAFRDSLAGGGLDRPRPRRRRVQSVHGSLQGSESLACRHSLRKGVGVVRPHATFLQHGALPLLLALAKSSSEAEPDMARKLLG